MLNAATLARWVADAAGRDLVLRAAHLVDAGAFEDFAALFTPDGVLQRPAGPPLIGPAAIAQAYRSRAPGRITRHLLLDTLTDAEGPLELRAQSRVLLWTARADDADGPQGRPLAAPALLGAFDDRLRCGHDGQWRIAHRRAWFEMHAGAERGAVGGGDGSDPRQS